MLRIPRSERSTAEYICLITHTKYTCTDLIKICTGFFHWLKVAILTKWRKSLIFVILPIRQLFLFCHLDSQFFGRQWTLKRWTEGRFYSVLERAGIENPIVPAGGGTKRRRITPHSCRHTFARLAGRVNAPTENISLLIGHSDTTMTRAYMDLTLAERRRITDQL